MPDIPPSVICAHVRAEGYRILFGNISTVAPGDDKTKARNRAAFDTITMMPSVLHGEVAPDLSTPFLDQVFSLPFGVAPVGMSSLIWPDAERHLARMARSENIPYTLSTVASQTPEDVSSAAAQDSWFQLYPPRDPEIRKAILTRAKNAGFTTLVLTVDLPGASRRERLTRSGLTQPPSLNPRILAQIARCPAWAFSMAKHGMPRMRLIDDYTPETKGLPSNAHAGYVIRTAPDWDYLKWVRNAWDGPLIVKGVLDASDVAQLNAEGVDAIWVSNHAGRQFDGAPAAIDVLAGIRAETQKPIILDSGIENGLDMLRAFARGANYVMLGTAWHYALGALGPKGASHLADILRQDLIANMHQMGLTHPSKASEKLL